MLGEQTEVLRGRRWAHGLSVAASGLTIVVCLVTLAFSIQTFRRVAAAKPQMAVWLERGGRRAFVARR